MIYVCVKSQVEILGATSTIKNGSDAVWPEKVTSVSVAISIVVCTPISEKTTSLVSVPFGHSSHVPPMKTYLPIILQE